MRIRVSLAVVFTLLALPVAALAADVPPLVSPGGLEAALADPGLVVVDIRKVEEYREGHVPGAANVFYGTWAVKRNDLDNELPPVEDLVDALHAAGITPTSRVVVVGKTDAVTDLVNATRVAWTLKYLGVTQVGVLDGGHTRWQAEKRALVTERGKRAPTAGDFTPRPAVFASQADVLAARGRATIVDTRGPEFYFGVTKLPFVGRAGHVSSAVSLPAPWIFTKEGTFKPAEELRAMAESVVGADRTKPIVVYCDTGRLASGWWWVLTQVLGYTDVRLFDGSAQEYAKDPAAPMTRFGWR